jgi:hypothetical protein
MKLGSNDISAVKIGSTDVSKVYIGSTEVWSSFTGLLDTYTGAAAAYSLRQLKSGVTNAIEVRIDTTGQPTYDIGFVDGELDVTTLEGYCTGGLDAYVTTWYDQSGNGYDATQTTAANQPQIVSSGSVITENGKPTINFDTSNKWLVTSNYIVELSQNAVSFHIVHSFANNALEDTYLVAEGDNTTPYSSQFIYGDASNATGIIWVNARSIGTMPTGQGLTGFEYDNANSMSVYANGSLSGSQSGLTINTEVYNHTSIGIAADLSTTGGAPRNIQEIISYKFDNSSNRTGIETNINAQYNIYWDGSQTSLLDSYSGSAAAYSLRALSSSYTGPLVEVRRASDNATQDIYAKYDGSLNVDALESFCSGTGGFVTTWYDQSGNGNDATQSTASEQPQIVSSGSVITENGKPALDFDATDDALIVWNNTTAPTLFQDMSDAITLLSVEKATAIGFGSPGAWYNEITLAEIRNNNNTTAHVPFNVGYSDDTSGFGVTDNYTFNAEVEFSSTLSVAQRLTSRYINGDDLDIYINNASAISTTFTVATGDRSVSTNNSTFSIGVRSRDGGQADRNYFRGTMQEIVLYKSNLLSDNSGINTNINDFYNIY